MPGRDPVYQALIAPAGEQIGSRLRREVETVANLARRQTCLAHGQLLIEKLKHTIWHSILDNTRITCTSSDE